MTSSFRGALTPCGVAPLLLAVGVAALVTSAASSSDADKRFDCSVFCKSTGFSGVVGGCRCSFTLFTSKRAYMPGSHHHLRAPGRSDDLSLLGRIFGRRLRRPADDVPLRPSSRTAHLVDNDGMTAYGASYQ
ncbi:hypothetical protein FJT64_022710 [Amphibalanus amphitrite]|uniref:Secreted protein n=1 Tax=Amphibalanus amphitrite TaxID=1232801 RepID=A0A6A4WUE2_AMPAM|nr:uncharacterized protein LOC122391918 [Amphibalanus amphitrite]KAF0305701.1 hypothetical protein FJT64_022710 [Amphibalanus amphitrite]